MWVVDVWHCDFELVKIIKIGKKDREIKLKFFWHISDLLESLINHINF